MGGAANDNADNLGSARQPIAIDLFSGAGGFSLGASQAGFRVVGALEYCRHAADSYRRNARRYRLSRNMIEEDILRVKPESALARWQVKPGECDLVLGGPPCQGFSHHRLKNSGVGDPRNALLVRYFEYVIAIRPHLFLMENVPGLLWDRHKEHLELFLQKADTAGYDVQAPVVLNAADYGVPQRRKRVFILGVNRDSGPSVLWPPKPTHADPKLIEVGSGVLPWANCAAAFETAVPQSDENAVHMRSSAALVEVFEATPLNGGSRRDSGRILPCHRAHDGHSDVYGRIDTRRPAPTMTTACINPSKGRFVHPTEHRGISVREAARIQTFPENFVFSGGLMAAGVQIGNAVPVQMAKTLLLPLHEALAGRTFAPQDQATQVQR